MESDLERLYGASHGGNSIKSMYQHPESRCYASAALLCSAFDSVGNAPGRLNACFAVSFFFLVFNNYQFVKRSISYLFNHCASIEIWEK